MTQPEADVEKLKEALDTEYENNCSTVASACEDFNHRNLARMAILSEHGVQIDLYDILNLKVELLLRELTGDDRLRLHGINFQFQQLLADLITRIENDHQEELGHHA